MQYRVIDIPTQEQQWVSIAKGIGSSDLDWLTTKAFYVTGVILGNCRSVEILLRRENNIETTYYPAYAVFASAVELLGRCLRGNTSDTDSYKDILAGFRWLKCPDVENYDKISVVVTLPMISYSGQ